MDTYNHMTKNKFQKSENSVRKEWQKLSENIGHTSDIYGLHEDVRKQTNNDGNRRTLTDIYEHLRRDGKVFLLFSTCIFHACDTGITNKI